MSLAIGALNVQDLANGYYFVILEGGPVDAVPVMRGERVLIPGRPGLYTPSGNFEPDHLIVVMKGVVTGSGSVHTDVRTSFASRFAALKTACDTATFSDVTLASDGYTIGAGFQRFVGPSLQELDGEARLDLVIEFIATNPPEWELTGS